MSLLHLRRPKLRSRAEELVDLLTTEIRSNRFKPGDKLPTESAVMTMAGVSRTVVREALSRLQASGLVETRHGIGTFVREPPTSDALGLLPINLPTLRDVLSVLEIRIGLETEAAALAAVRRTEQHLEAMRAALNAFKAEIGQPDSSAAAPDIAFHEQIALATGNNYFVDVLHHLGKAIIPRTRISINNYAAGDQSSYLKRVNREHESILDAITQKDASAARLAMHTHLSRSSARLRQTLEIKSSR